MAAVIEDEELPKRYGGWRPWTASASRWPNGRCSGSSGRAVPGRTAAVTADLGRRLVRLDG
jgi:hypothetical protein